MTNEDLSTISDIYGISYCDQLEALEPLAPSQSIYGRDDEVSALRKAYECLLKTKKVQTVVVHGVSGSGKTALIDTLRDPVIDTNGYFVAGKYFQNVEVQEPYSAIMAAFSDLCDLFIQSNDFDTVRRQEIADALNPYAPMLLKAITSILPLVGAGVDQFALEASSFAKFKVACSVFLNTVASDEHPIVIFLDDIQWADHGSNELIEVFLRESSGFKNVMFILAHRSEALEQVATILDNVPNPTEIVLSNLDTTAVHYMVASMLGSDSDQISEMSNLVANRTCGNPMHVLLFVEMIQDEGLLVYNENTNSWQFDVANIQEEMMVSDTLADLLIRKIERLPSGDTIKEILKVASMMGYSFDELALLEVMDRLSHETNQGSLRNDNSSVSDSIGPHNILYGSLSEAIKQGFIEKVRAGYQFTHDKLQSAFQSFIAESEETHLHELIGKAFLAQSEHEKSNIYRAAVHLNCVPDFLSVQENRRKLARINLEAAKYCKEKCAFDKALVALQRGLECLGTVERWDVEHSSLTFEIMEALARIQLIIGECEACKATIRETLCRDSISAELNISLQLVDVEARIVGNEVNGALIAANRALVTTLGIKMPHKVSIRHVAGKLIKVKWMLRKKTNESILNLPSTRNILMANAVKLLMHICSFCLLKNEPDTGVFFALLATELTLKHGLSQYSSSAFAIYGVAEAALGRIDRAHRFGKVALAMIDEMGCREAECQTIGFALPMLECYRQPIRTLVDPLYKAALSGLQYGDVAYGVTCLSHCFGMHIALATNLASLEDLMRTAYDRVCDLGQQSLILMIKPPIQYVLNMQSDATSWDNISVLSGEIINEDEYFDQARGKQNNVLILMGLLLKANLAAVFNQFSIAASLFEESESYGANTIRLSYAAPNNCFVQARIHFELFDSTGKRQHLRKARRFKKRLHSLVLNGNPNAASMYTYLITIESIVKTRFKDDAELRHAYSSGMNSIEGTGYHSLAAFFSEKAGFTFAKRGRLVEAEHFFDRALHIYEHEWGARAKYNQLQQQSTSALPHVAMETPHGTFINLTFATQGDD